MNATSYQTQESVGGMINIVAYRFRQAMDQRLREFGLDVSVWPVLVCLWREDGVPQARIGERLGVPGYAMSRGVDRLASLGMVTRRGDPENRRIRRIFLTPAGRDLESVLAPIAAEINARALSPLAADEQRQLLDMLRRLVEHG